MLRELGFDQLINFKGTTTPKYKCTEFATISRARSWVVPDRIEELLIVQNPLFAGSRPVRSLDI
jgi:hypothetical protein